MTGREIGEDQAPTLPGITEGEILVIRSTRRKKSASAYRQGGRIVISLPARMSKAEEAQVVPELIAIIRGREEAKTPTVEALANRIDALLSELAPDYALDYVLFHEAIHLQWSDHGQEFTDTLARFEGSELASAYLDGWEAAERAMLDPVELKKLGAKG